MNLIGTYIKNEDGELKDKFLAECEKQGIELYSDGTLEFNYIRVGRVRNNVHTPMVIMLIGAAYKPLGQSKLTLSDFNKKRRVDSHILLGGVKAKLDWSMMIGVDEDLLIVKAGKPKRTKVSYEKVSFDKLSEAFTEHEKAPLHTSIDDQIVNLMDIRNYPQLMDCEIVKYKELDSIYRKVEVEIKPMQAAKDACDKFIEDCKYMRYDDCFNDFLSDAVDNSGGSMDENFISLFRAIVNAYDGK